MAPRRLTRAAAALALALLLAAPAPAAAKVVTVRNDVPRLDTDGNIIDCHSGNIIAVDGIFYMIGEHYGNSSGMGPSPPLLFPKIVVYTSPDFESWTFRGFALHDWPTKPYGTFFTPWVVYNKATSTFVLWFNAYLHGVRWMRALARSLRTNTHARRGWWLTTWPTLPDPTRHTPT